MQCEEVPQSGETWSWARVAENVKRNSGGEHPGVGGWGGEDRDLSSFIFVSAFSNLKMK